MGPRVELINNPYTQRLSILIDGTAVSVYSNLEKYMDEPFLYWCDKILDDIYEECNQSSFRLHFCSRQEEIAVMEKIVTDYPHCTQFSSAPLVRPTSLAERMKGLNDLIRSKQITGYRTSLISLLFIIPEGLKALEQDLRELEVKNVYCRVASKVVSYQDFQKRPEQADMIIFFADGRPIGECISRLRIQKGFGIYTGNTTTFRKKLGDVFICETTQADIFQTVFNCLLLSPLANAFVQCVRSVAMATGDRYKRELEDLCSVSVRVIPKPEKTTLEVGRSSRIQFETDVPGYAIKGAQLHYTYSEKGIICCNGMSVEGLKAGKATLHILKEGEQIPCASVEYTVIQRNRITELRFEESTVYLGEGDKKRLSYTFLPPDADNVDTIRWDSDNPQIVRVDNYGNLQALKKGSCKIRCYAEQESACCTCVVKPYLRDIQTDCGEIDLIYGQSQELNIKLVPEDCLDGKLKITSMNMQIANVVGKTVKAVGLGTTRIIIQNAEETKRKEIQVHVMSEKEYKKMQKKKGGGAEQKKEKTGFLSRLFG